MKIKLHSFNLELKHTFTISRESHDFQETLIIELNSDGFSGFGEATSNPYYNSTTDKMIAIISKNKAFNSIIIHRKTYRILEKITTPF